MPGLGTNKPKITDMKKPNITEGEWWVNTLGQHHNNPDIQQHEICWSPDAECVVDHVYSLADAKAISAVPEMIDALMAINESDEARKVMGSVARTKMIEALEKAGCHE